MSWPWKVGLSISTPELVSGIRQALEEAGSTVVFGLPAEASAFDMAHALQRGNPEVLFVEFSKASRAAAEWMSEIRGGQEMPLVVAVHAAPEPAEMISALRAGASEFISPPLVPAIHEAMERIGALLESVRTKDTEKGRIAGILSAKGGCGATTIACHLGAALQAADSNARVLVADLDYQSPGAHHVLRVAPETDAGAAFDSVARLNSNSWKEFVTRAGAGVELLASAGINDLPAPPPEQWRVESLFRFVSKQYGWVLADLGRQLTPANWMYLQCVEELYLVTAPDVLALYQTRSILQTLASRGFDKSRIKMILNRNQSSPQDFWVESIEQMFEMSVFAVIPNDLASMEKLSRQRFEFPAETQFGRAMKKFAARITKPAGPGSGAPFRRGQVKAA